MKLIFALYKYFPFGGLQKDMLAIAVECASRSHDITIYCRDWQGELPGHNNIEVRVLHNSAVSNQGKDAGFSRDFRETIKQLKPDLVIGFNKIPGVDIYYAADTCFKAKLYRERPWLYRWLPRYRRAVSNEERLFGAASHTHILALAQPAIDEYKHFYQTPAEHFSLLSPGISRDRINSGERQFLLHDELGLSREQKIILMVGSGFRTKGLDRAIAALAAQITHTPNLAHLAVVGDDKADVFIAQAKALGVEQQVHFLGGRKDVPQLLASADVLIHPAYRENTGTVLLEAAVARLPVITTDVCGYARYIAEHQLGTVLPSPFVQEQLNVALAEALGNSQKIQQWHQQARHFAQTADIYDMPKTAADIISRLAARKGREV